ncbi:MAG: hypothetical protein ABI868_10855 [Acidobacteriota bacterium]
MSASRSVSLRNRIGAGLALAHRLRAEDAIVAIMVGDGTLGAGDAT